MENCKVLGYTLRLNEFEKDSIKMENDLNEWIQKGYSVKGITSHAMQVVVLLEKPKSKKLVI